MNYELNWLDNNLYICFEGNICFNELYNISGQIYGNSKFDAMKYLIFDFSEIDNLLLTKNEIKMLSALDKSASRWNNSIKLAFVTNNTNIKDILSNYCEYMQVIKWEVKVFSTLLAANKWCNENESIVTNKYKAQKETSQKTIHLPVNEHKERQINLIEL